VEGGRRLYFALSFHLKVSPLSFTAKNQERKDDLCIFHLLKPPCSISNEHAGYITTSGLLYLVSQSH
jgi:hypothetical protein